MKNKQLKRLKKKKPTLIKQSKKEVFETTYDGTFRHPFTMLVTGPSGSGKSTFIKNLIKHSLEMIDQRLDYIFIFIGTSTVDNQSYIELQEYLDQNKSLIKRFEIFEVNSIYTSIESLKQKFSNHILETIKQNNKSGQKGLLIFDDLMEELTKCNILVSLWTKHSSHLSVSVIYITQNITFKSGSKDSDMVTVFRNTKNIVVFRYKLDGTVVRNVSQKVGPGIKNRQLQDMINEICKRYRYCLIRGDLERSDDLQFSSDIFGLQQLFYPNTKQLIRYQLVFTPTFY